MGDKKRQVLALFEEADSLRAGEVAQRLGVSRQTAHRYLSELVEDGILVREGAGRSTRYRLRRRLETRRYLTEGLEEDRVWAEMGGPESRIANLSDRARAVLRYAVTEMVNNVIDHSQSETVEIVVERANGRVSIEIRDHGVGIFEHIRSRCGLASELEALQDLSKGKLTTMPERHTGEGIFFTSKAVTRFEIRSGSLRWIVDNEIDDMAVGSVDPPARGTLVRLEVEDALARDLTEVFAEFSEDFQFTKTRTVVRLFAIGTEFVSRSEAKRLTVGLDRFREVVLDFDRVELVGQGFADEVFRVWANNHPEISLVPVSMSKPVEFMVERAMRQRSDSG